MTNPHDADRKRRREILGGRLLLLAFGLGALTYLVAIDRADWFSIRPATGTSIAMSNAAAPANSEAKAPQ